MGSMVQNLSAFEIEAQNLEVEVILNSPRGTKKKVQGGGGGVQGRGGSPREGQKKVQGGRAPPSLSSP